MSNTNTGSQQIGSAFDLLGRSVELVRRNWLAFLVVNIIGLLGALAAFMPGTDTEFINAANFDTAAILSVGLAVMVVVAVVNIFLYTMMTSLQVRASGGQQPAIGELARDGAKYFFRLLGLIIIEVVIIVLGLLLLIVPGIIAIGRLAMAPYFMLDKNLSIGEALSQSNRMGKAYFGKIWAAIGVFILVSIGASIIGGVGDIGQLLGALIAIAFSLILPLRYQQLKNLPTEPQK
jgi:hypothetical protein